MDINEKIFDAICQNDLRRLLDVLALLSSVKAETLEFAIQMHRTEMVKHIIPKCNLQEDNSALTMAATNGNIEIVRMLLPLCNPKSDGSSALYWAAVRGHLEVVKELLPHSTPKAQKSRALFAAVKNNHQGCVDLLYPVSEPYKALKELQQLYSASPQKWNALAERVNADRQRLKLRNAIGDSPAAPKKRM